MEFARKQQDVNVENAAFWNELCGTGLAQHIGIKDHSLESLKKFDQYYINMYPYLLGYVKPELMKNKRVLEIGLGYGTLGQVIANAGADYYGLDIAEGPVKMMNHRLRMLGLSEAAQQGNMLECPFESNSFDAVVSIGCFHHTGNLQKCFDHTFRILKPGGRAVMMVYNKYSFRQWSTHFGTTLSSLCGSPFFLNKTSTLSKTRRAAYDANQSGDAAPETVLSSISELREMLQNFSSVALQKENCDGFWHFKREQLLGSLGKIAGLDIYIECVK